MQLVARSQWELSERQCVARYAVSENARKGGLTVKARYGLDFYAQIGKKGGAIVKERHGAHFYSDIGKQGGTTTRQLLGVAHYERIGRLGGLCARQGEQQRPAAEG